MRTWLTAALVAAGVMWTPTMASAEIDSGDCTGSLEFMTGTSANGPFTLDADRARDDVVVVPRSDTVRWSASTPATSGTYSGSLKLALPFPFGSVQIESWSGEVQSNSNSGTEDYELPSIVPSGVAVELSATHTDEAGTCAGSQVLEVEGGPWSTATVISLVVTLVLAGAMLAVAGVIGGSSGSAAAKGV